VDDVRRSIESGKIAPVYVLTGEETFVVGRWLDAIREAVLGKDGDAWNSETLEGPVATADRILSAARTLPMLGGRRLVVVRQAEALGSAEQEKIAAYLARPAETTTLVLVATKLAGKLAAEAKRLGFLHKAEALKDREAGAFAQARAQVHGAKLDARAAKALVELLGADAGAIDDAIERLLLYVGDAKRAVTVDDVHACVAPHRQATVFVLVDAVGAGDAKAALEALGALLREREPGLLVLWWVARGIRQLAIARTARSSGEAAAVLGVPPFIAEKIHRASRAWSEEALRASLRLLAQADLDLKGSKIPETLVLETLVLALGPRP